ncbi:MAG: DUF362 domain-containing protein [Candidatus Fermentibacteraceae bacterium]|nr:DUF362 domain-containing protein [Candidatus Fermentibacteraceae bacterium]
MSTVYLWKATPEADVEMVQRATRTMLDRLVQESGIELEGTVPLKVHFGEVGNVTFIRPENYDGIIDYLECNGIRSCFMETSALYGGQRYKRELHEKTAIEHGFTRLPLVMADGDRGESFVEIMIDGRHFKSCKIGRAVREHRQMLIVSHFKGHILSGFGGAIKQLSMGCASKGGKLAMHMGVKPRIRNRKCRRCHLCEPRCGENAITIGEKSFIDHERCVGCGACVAICPHRAISIFSLRGAMNAFGLKAFREKLVEYACASQKDLQRIYVNFAMNITRGCDCEPRRMKPLLPDVGVFASTDPVAIDRACFDMIRDRGTKFRGADTFAYAESMGLGSSEYSISEVLVPRDTVQT